jgi:hypothetical protein
MLTTNHRTPAVVAASVLTAAVVCLSLAGCAPHYNHRGETIGGAAHVRTFHPSIITGVIHGGRR